MRIGMRIRMLICMRTTVVLDDELVKKAKKRAAELRTTLSEVINQALREAVSKSLPRRSAFKMITYGGPKSVHHEPEDFKRILEEEDIRSLRART